MQPITKTEMDFLIKNNIIKCKSGRLKGLVTGSKKKHGNGKPRFVEDPIYWKLLELQKQQNVEEN